MVTLEEGLIAVLRYSDHADPLYCKCGKTWGEHGLSRDHDFKYDFANPRNALIKLRSGFSCSLTRTISAW